jgi:hypothetical protein
MAAKSKAFWFHFNKPASKAAKKPQITLHWNDSCHILDNIVCQVPISGRIRKNQPRWVIAGRGKVTIENGVATIN